MSESDRIEGIHRPGVLNPEQIQRLIEQKSIDGWSRKKDKDIDGSSFDLHISERYWKLPAGFKCGKDRTIETFIQSAKQVIVGIKPETFHEDAL